jgi:hypothetical protein
MRRIFLTILLVMLFSSKPGYAIQEYKEKAFSQGKVIYGLREEEALNKYGVPTAIEKDLWFYDGPEKLYIYMDEQDKVYLYPRFIRGYIGLPLELKTLAGGQEIEDVTTRSELLLSDPDAFNIAGKGVLVPREAGKFEIISVYKDRYSNASFIFVTEPKKDPAPGEKLASIDILPYKPYVNPKNPVYFYAFGTFCLDGSYSVREITRQVDWFKEQNGQILKMESSNIPMDHPGKFKVFCKYQGLESAPQEGEVAQKPEQLNRYLKQVTVLPVYVAVTTQTSVPFYAFATYGDNSMEDVTERAGWVIKDNAILEREGTHNFSARLVGVTEIQGVLGNMRSLPAKVVVSYSPVNRRQERQSGKAKISPQEMLNDIKEDVRDLNRKVTEEKGLKYIKIVPDRCELPAGAQKQLSAFAVRQDNSEEDITVLVRWAAFDNKIASVKSGLVNALSPGETKICIQYKKSIGQCIPVVVEKARLVSILVSPQYLQIGKGERRDLKAEGYFGDSSQDDITPLVKWSSENTNIARMDESKVLGVRVGKSKIFAEHSGVRSLPAEVDVVEEKYWLFKLISKILLFVFLASSVLYAYFYIATDRVKRHILCLYSHPRDLTIALYRNLVKIISIFGIRHKFYVPPLFLADLADKKYSISEELFLKFTQQYEEAKYSSHVFPPEASGVVLEAYNNILKRIFARQKKRILVCKYLAALIKAVPFFIRKK